MTDLTMNEQKHVRVALLLFRHRFGRWKMIAKLLHYRSDTLEKIRSGRRNVTPTLAFRVANLAGVSVDELFAGKYAPPGTCPNCGHTPDFNDEETIADRRKMADG